MAPGPVKVTVPDTTCCNAGEPGPVNDHVKSVVGREVVPARPKLNTSPLVWLWVSWTVPVGSFLGTPAPDVYIVLGPWTVTRLMSSSPVIRVGDLHQEIAVVEDLGHPLGNPVPRPGLQVEVVVR